MQALCLTSTRDLHGLMNAMRANHIPCLKVITGWGIHDQAWTADTRKIAASLSGLIVRTVDGDGTRPPYPGEHYIYPQPRRVYDELLPWVSIKPQLVVELGNEPNAYTAAPPDAPYVFNYYMQECIKMIRAEFKSVRIITPGLIEGGQHEWWQKWHNEGIAPLVDGIGYHAYNHHSPFKPGDTGQIQRAHQSLGQIFHDRSWWLTEYGINDRATPDADKCAIYSELHMKVPSDVAVCCWYHACSDPINTDQENYSIDPAAFPALQSGGRIP